MAPKKKGKGKKEPENTDDVTNAVPKSGTGEFTIPSAQGGPAAVYSGQWTEVKCVEGETPTMLRVQHGVGEIKFEDGSVAFSGEWQLGKMIKGTYSVGGDEGTVYEGGFDEAQRFHGPGVLTNASGDRYEGEFRNHTFHGQGRLVLVSDNTEWSGTFEDGEYKGVGGKLVSLKTDPKALPPTLRHLLT